MQTRAPTRLPSEVYAVEVYKYGSAQNASTLTTLLAFTDLGSDYRSLTVHILNLDVSNPVTLIVDVSHGGTSPNTFRQQQVDIAAGDEGSIEIGEPNPYTFVRISAQTASPTFPTVQIKWAVVAMPR